MHRGELTSIVEDGSLVLADQLTDWVLEGDGGLRGGSVGLLGWRGATLHPLSHIGTIITTRH